MEETFWLQGICGKIHSRQHVLLVPVVMPVSSNNSGKHRLKHVGYSIVLHPRKIADIIQKTKNFVNNDTERSCK